MGGTYCHKRALDVRVRSFMPIALSPIYTMRFGRIRFSRTIKSYRVQYEIAQSCVAYDASYGIELLSIPYDLAYLCVLCDVY